MRIGIDSRPLREKRTSGIPAYVRNLLQSLSRIDKENEYILYAHKDFDYDLENKRWTKKSGALTQYGTVWMQMELPFWLKRDRVDIFWGTQHTLPVFTPSDVKAVLTVHDLVHLIFPETMRLKNLIINKFIIPPSIRRTNAIVGVSEWTLNDVRKYLNPKNKIMRAIHSGVGRQFSPKNKKEAKAKIQSLFHISDPFILTVGTFEPRKNLEGSFRAFERIVDKIPHHLLIVGQKGWKNKKTIREIKKSKNISRIHFMGYVEDDILPSLYKASDVFLFPSLYEGFGIPPLEAMACGVPVVASNVSSIPEVVGDGAVLVNPNNPENIAEGILNLLNDSDFREKMILRGKKQAEKYSWDKAAQKMVNLFSDIKNNS